MKKSYEKFQNIVLDWYQQHGRHDLPWRPPAGEAGKTKDSYKIWVSEIMLQQTQVGRVQEKYKSFLKKFPTLRDLAEASQGDVLKEWVGLGYNRRALNLWRGAKFVVEEWKGRLPKEVVLLETIPGIGHYTARAIATFAYNQKHAFVETNIRTVYFNHFFKGKDTVSDGEILELVEQTLPRENFREWYYSLMDYGSFLKKEGKGMNTRSKHYTKQSKFEGSDRQIRAAVVRYLTKEGKTEFSKLLKVLPFDEERMEIQIQKLLDEEMIFLKKGILGLEK
jgi:A/G-specific adenine glycosylase